MLDWIGYIASLIVLISLLMSSIKKLRWINLVGAALFGAYGFMIGSLPTGLMNVGIALIDIFYLVRMYKSREYFKVLPIEQDSDYLHSFLDFYNEDITKFNELDYEAIENATIKFYILRNMSPAGIFICQEYDSKTLTISLDYVIPQYRDFKIGNFVFETQQATFLAKGYHRFIVFTDNKAHINYVKKMGFSPSKVNGKDCFIKEI